MQNYVEEAKRRADKVLPSGGGYFGEGRPGRFIIALHLMVLERLDKLAEDIRGLHEKIDAKLCQAVGVPPMPLHTEETPPVIIQPLYADPYVVSATVPDRHVKLVNKPCMDCGTMMENVPPATKRCSKCREAKK